MIYINTYAEGLKSWRSSNMLFVGYGKNSETSFGFLVNLPRNSRFRKSCSKICLLQKLKMVSHVINVYYFFLINWCLRPIYTHDDIVVWRSSPYFQIYLIERNDDYFLNASRTILPHLAIQHNFEVVSRSYTLPFFYT